MNKLKYALIIGAVLIVSGGSSFYRGDYINIPSKADQDTLQRYPDGKYSGQSRHTYTDEPYWGRVDFTLKEGMITEVTFIIRDSNLNETFDTLYKKHFESNELYIQQCRNDWNGVQTYPKKLIEAQDIDRIDAISGATWSYNIFKASVKDALNKAKKDPD